MKIAKYYSDNRKYLIWIFLIGVAVSLPANFYGLFKGYDFKIHLVWSRLFFEEFSNGTLYPRWLSDAYGGYGSPVFYFYPPLPYFITLLTYWLFSTFKIIWLPLTASFSLAHILSGFTSYIWLKKFFTPKISFFGAIVYMLFPYHLSTDFYNRAAFAESWSFVWLPLLMLHSYNILSKNKNAVLLFAVFYAALVLTHLPTALIFSPFPLLYYIFAIKKIQFQSLSRIVLGYVIGLGLAAFYLVPAISYQKFVQISSLMRFNYSNNFLLSNPYTVDGITSNWVYNNFIITLALIIIGVIYRYLKKESRNKLTSWFIIFALAFFMATPLSLPIWKLFSFIQIISFPWRFLVIVTLAFTFIFTYFISSERLRNHNFFIWALLIILFGSNIIFISFKVFKSKILIEKENPVTIYEKSKNSFSPPEYLPKDLYNDSLLKRVPVPLTEILSGNAKITQSKKISGNVAFTVNSITKSSIRINQFYFSGWSTESNEEKIKVSREGTLVRLSIPKGTYTVDITINKLKEHSIANYISLSFLIVSSLLFLSQNLITKTNPYNSGDN